MFQLPRQLRQRRQREVLQQLWGGPSPKLIGEYFEKLHSLGVMSPTLKAIVEIGPGTGVWTNKLSNTAAPCGIKFTRLTASGRNGWQKPIQLRIAMLTANRSALRNQTRPI